MISTVSMAKVDDPQKLKPKFKTFTDSVHGNIELHEACVAIIDTEQFQRLRYIKQLGLSYYVYPGASHNRFEHSLGVCHLAGKLVRAFQRKQVELKITDKDILCVEIAGLCHDLGHGPFSHTFESRVTHDLKVEFKHEKASQEMLHHLLTENKLMDRECGILTRWGLDKDDISFIMELIDRPDEGKSKVTRYAGKEFLYEVVSNKRNGIDVDKWDYFARDCHHLGIRNSFDHLRFIEFARVLKGDNDEWLICGQEKEVVNLYNMYYTRYSLHKMAYQHEVVIAIEIMMSEALVKANNFIKIGRNQNKMSECIHNMEDFVFLNDFVMFKILESEEDELKESKDIIKRILNRDLYTCIATSPVVPSAVGRKLDTVEIKETMLIEIKSDIKEKQLKEIEEKHLKEIKEKQLEYLKDDFSGKEKSNDVIFSDFIVEKVKWDFGMTNKNPMEKVKVYRKSEPDVAISPEVVGLILIPQYFEEFQLRVYSRTKDTDVCDLIKRVFNNGTAFIEDVTQELLEQ